MNESSNTYDCDCVVVGGGPGGWSAALYLARYRRHVILAHAGASRAQWIPRTHNLIGYDRGITGPLLLKRLSRHARRYGVESVQGWARVEKPGRTFEVHVSSRKIRAPYVILATGIEDIQPKISNLTELRKSGLLRYCPICDGYEFREKKIAVLVQDMRGLRSSLFISDYARCLELAIPAELKIPEALKRELLTRRVRFHYGALIAIARSHSPGGLRIELQGCKAFHCDVAYVELGARLRDEAFRTIQGLRLSKNMRIMTDSHQESSVQGLYAIGDCVESLAQISVAAAQGAIAATAVHNRLRNQLLGLQAK